MRHISYETELQQVIAILSGELAVREEREQEREEHIHHQLHAMKKLDQENCEIRYTAV